MSTLTIILICLAVHIMLTFIGWLYNHIVYSKNGKLDQFKPTSVDAFLTFCPVINITYIFLFLADPPKINEKKLTKYSKLFKIKQS
jgi:hypothetical protein